MRRSTALLAAVALVAATLATTGPLAAQTDEQQGNRQVQALDRGEAAAERGALGTFSGDLIASHPDDEALVFIHLSQPSVIEAANRGLGVTTARQRSIVNAEQNGLRARLSAEGIAVTEHSALQTAVNGIQAFVRAGDIPTIAAINNVVDVVPVTLHEPANTSSVPWIGAPDVWEAPDGATGDGVIIAIIDSGIDYTHAAMGGSGDPADYAAIDPTSHLPDFNDKVIDGFDFAGPVYDASSPDPAQNTPQPDLNPLDVDGHGTHVASSAAGLEVEDGGNVLVGPGVAPDARLVALKVFGDVAGSTAVVPDAIEWVLDYNLDNPAEPIDVINMSLGASYGHPGDPSALAAQNAAESGVTVVVASGNAGHIHYITSSPAIAPDAISVAASLAGNVPFLQIQVNEPEEVLFDAAAAGFGDPLPGDPGITEEVIVAVPVDACLDDPDDGTGQELDNAADIDGEIVLVRRGECEFSDKVLRAQNSGASAVIIANNVAGPPSTPGAGMNAGLVDIPSVMISQDDGDQIIDWIADEEVVEVTMSADLTVTLPEFDDTMASFTSQGPGFASVFKPEITAPGVSVNAAGVGSGDRAVPSSGTSMATPHVAGVAALLHERYPDADVDTIKSLILNSATPAVANPGPDPVPLARQGVGRVNADRAALDAGAYTTPAAVSLGRADVLAPTTLTDTVTVTTLDGGDATYSLTLEGNVAVPGATWSISQGSVTTSGGTGSFGVSLDLDPANLPEEDWFYSHTETDAWVVLENTTDPADTLRVGLLAVPDPAAEVAATGGEDSVALANSNATSVGIADAFNLVGEGTGELEAVGWRTVPGPFGDIIQFGVALEEGFSSPSSRVIDVWIDVDGDGQPDYLLEAADLGLLLGIGFVGQVATVLVEWPSFDVVDLAYFTVTDFNDRVTILQSDFDGPFGFLAGGDTEFSIDVVVGTLAGDLLGVSLGLDIDLADEILLPDLGPSLLVPPGVGGDLAVDGEGELLWLYAGNPLPTQTQIVTVGDDPGDPDPGAPDPGDPDPGDPDPGDPDPDVPIEFGDVPPGHLFHTEITWLAGKGITRGCNPPVNDLFCPDDAVSRGQMAAFLNRTLELPATDEEFFMDVGDVVFEGDINRLAAAGVTRGCNPPVNDLFCPHRFLTRAEMATFMMRGFGFTDGAGADLFTDDDGNVHETAIDILGTVGVTRGCNPPVNDLFCPDRLITRGEMAAFIFRAFQAAGLD